MGARDHPDYSVHVVTAVREGPFTGEWVRENWTPPRRWGDRRPDDESDRRIAAAFNYVCVKESYRTAVAAAGIATVTIHTTGQTTRFEVEPSSRQRWKRLILGLSTLPWIELSAVTKGRVGFTPDGPIVQLLYKAIPLITGERPTAETIAKELQRQRGRRRSG